MVKTLRNNYRWYLYSVVVASAIILFVWLTGIGWFFMGLPIYWSLFNLIMFIIFLVSRTERMALLISGIAVFENTLVLGMIFFALSNTIVIRLSSVISELLLPILTLSLAIITLRKKK